jgi:hypothetical protein
MHTSEGTLEKNHTLVVQNQQGVLMIPVYRWDVCGVSLIVQKFLNVVILLIFKKANSRRGFLISQRNC